MPTTTDHDLPSEAESASQFLFRAERALAEAEAATARTARTALAARARAIANPDDICTLAEADVADAYHDHATRHAHAARVECRAREDVARARAALA